VCVYEFLWRTPAACPVDLKTELLQEDDGCTVAIPGIRNRYRDVSEVEPYLLECSTDTMTMCAAVKR